MAETLLKSESQFTWERVINDGALKIAIVGAGYIGLPLALLCGQMGVKAASIDRSSVRRESLSKGLSPIGTVPSERANAVVDSGLFSASVKYQACAVVICGDHSGVGHEKVLGRSSLIMDKLNLLRLEGIKVCRA